MMRKVAITGGNILTALGDLDQTWAGLMAGQSGLVRQKWDVVQPEYPIGQIAGLSGYGTSWQRLQSVLDLLITQLPAISPDTAVYLASTKGAVDEYLQKARQEKTGQPWQLGGWLQERLGTVKKTRTVSAACSSGTIGIIQAAMAIQSGECSRALVIGIDLIGDFILTGFDSLKALSLTVPRPFDSKRDGLALGDGCGWVLLADETEVTGEAEAWIEGLGISCDATHITAPCRHGSGLKRTISQTVSGGQTIGGINAHGTGTVYNDAMELVAFNELCPEGTPVCSVKGALGHSLGAAGVIEALLSVKSLQDMVLPPRSGL